MDVVNDRRAKHSLMNRPGSSFRTFIYDRHPHSQSRSNDSYSKVQAEFKITLVEELAAIQAGTTGLRTWTAAQVTFKHAS
jgi:hypothetical protein